MYIFTHTSGEYDEKIRSKSNQATKLCLHLEYLKNVISFLSSTQTERTDAADVGGQYETPVVSFSGKKWLISETIAVA